MSNPIQNSPKLDLSDLFPFELDDFQKEAIAALDEGKSVVVCAPTGAGKTLIGEYSIHRALANGRRVFYTTPLKALSNQKLRDFREQFGDEMVGLLTGDISFHRDAPILVMTTEIFRNMLYGTPIGQVGTSLEGVEAVVLDECHYMNDRQRGTVWEESIIYCPRNIQLLALSATVDNQQQLTDWIRRVHGPTELISSDSRPVPVEFYFCNSKGMFPLLDGSKRRISPSLAKSSRARQRGGYNRKSSVPEIADIVSRLQQRDMLPAIYFIFSRRGCDRAVGDVSHLSLVNRKEAAILRDRIDRFIKDTPGAARPKQLEPLAKGIASHHAGLLPAWKMFVEELFQEGLIKVVFATETLAAGINMPARTTVISSLSKRTDDGHRLLRASEFLQMSGRAGRRGMDTIGHVVTVETPFEGAQEAAYLATSKPNPLVSQFSPSYGMVLNLLQTHSLEEAKNLVESSFGQYTSTIHLVPAEQYIKNLEAKLAEVEAELGLGEDLDINTLEETLADYEKQQQRLKQEKRLLKTLQKQAREAHTQKMAEALDLAEVGTLVSLRGKHVPTARKSDSEPISAVLVAQTPSPGQAPYFIVLGRDNRWYIVGAMDVVSLQAELPRLTWADHLEMPEMQFKLGQSRRGDEITEALAVQIPELLVEDTAPEVANQITRIEQVEEILATHPAEKFGKPQKILKRLRRRKAIQKEIVDYQEELRQYLERNWREFLNLIDILQEFEALDDLQPTKLGQATAALRGDNELWLGLVLMSGEFDNLEPYNLAGACSALVTEVSRSDSWTHYQLSEVVQETLNRLWSLRRSLIKVQGRHHVEFLVLPERREHQRLSAILEQWAGGVEWAELVKNTTLDEGDIVRIIRRTRDFLSQIPHVPHLSSTLKDNAIEAKNLIDRFPVNEGVQ
ncbi:DEAD/DEAH box helicase [Limnospira fusiformis]|uniref:DEAD/DEAH box helicase n=1 Tax=Limnospira fusiformis TaxID=54297 RepID=UPI001448BA08|nr:DEAD/DEAH box helicase [Limnospira fusiformis SAG 85.79]